MSSGILAIMLGVSTFLGALGLAALLWGLRTGQFDDQKKFIDGAQFDNEEDLKDAAKMEQKKKEAIKKKEKSYMPPD